MADPVSEIKQDLRDAGLDLDMAADRALGGPPRQTLSQSVGLYLLSGSWWAKPCSWFLTLFMNERHHAVRSLYGDDGSPIFPDRMPEGAPSSNPYPALETARPSLPFLALLLCLSMPAHAQEHCFPPDEIRANALADWGVFDTLRVLVETEAPEGFKAEEIVAIQWQGPQVLLIFFHDSCAVHHALIPQEAFEELRRFVKGQDA